jgi:hypothetical protein
MNDVTKEDDKEIIAKIRWTLEFEYPVFNSDDEHILFHLEESHCQENLLDYLVSKYEDGKCKLCSIGNVEVLEIIR